MLTGGAGLSAEEEKGPAYRFGTERSWAVGCLSASAERLPRGLLLFFVYFFFFFSFNLSFKTFQNNPN
jgi:hypothetical protein